MAGTYWPWVPFHFGHWTKLDMCAIRAIHGRRSDYLCKVWVCSPCPVHLQLFAQHILCMDRRSCKQCNIALAKMEPSGKSTSTTRSDMIEASWSCLKFVGENVFFSHALTLNVFSAWEILRKPIEFLTCNCSVSGPCIYIVEEVPVQGIHQAFSRDRGVDLGVDPLDLHLICHGWHSRLQKPSTSISYDFIIFYLLSYCANAFKVFHSMHTIIVLYCFSEQLGNCCPCSQVCQHRKTFFKHEPVQHCEDLWSTVGHLYFLDMFELYHTVSIWNTLPDGFFTTL